MSEHTPQQQDTDRQSHGFSLHEIGNTYVSPTDRFVVSLVAGYQTERDDVHTPEEALAAALDLTRDGGSWDTQWYVYDRETKVLHMIEQKQGEPGYEK